MLRVMLGFDTNRSKDSPVNVLVLIAASMRAHGRGGTLLVVPANTTEWKTSIVSPVLYSVSPPFAGLSDLLARQSTMESPDWEEDLRRAVDALAGLTAVDGATLVDDRYELLAFGAKIARGRGQMPVERVLVTEPIEGSVATEATPVQLGGTRHLSAAQFVHDQRNASALVASQDGRFTIFHVVGARVERARAPGRVAVAVAAEHARAMMSNVEAKGLSVVYQRAGSGPALVLLHGFALDSRSWRPQLDGLSDRFTVIAWDAPGTGQSHDPPGTFGIGDWADALAEVLAFARIQQAHIVGLSWGGLLAQEFYRRYPSRVMSLVLAGTVRWLEGVAPRSGPAAAARGGGQGLVALP